MKIKEAEWVDRFPSRGVDPMVAARVFTSMSEKRGGELSPRAVWQAHRSPTAPLHNLFTWDDTKAAEAWRDGEAGNAMRSLRVVYVGAEDAGPVRYLANIQRSDETEDGKSIYATVERTLMDPDLRSRFLAQALAELRSFESRYKQLTELRDVFKAIEKARIGGGAKHKEPQHV